MTLIGHILSIFFLTLLLIIYFTSKTLRNLAGKILISLSASLILSQFTFLIAGFLYTDQDSSTTDSNNSLITILNNKCKINHFKSIENMIAYIWLSNFPCYFFGLLTHYFYLSFFAWSQIMGFDLYKMFMLVSSKSKSFNLDDENDSVKFAKYSLYAWTMPMVIVFLNVASQFAFKKMAYGFKKCFISDTLDLIIFFILPVVFILSANVYYLVWSIRTINSVDKTSRKYLKKDTATAATTSSLIKDSTNKSCEKKMKLSDESNNDGMNKKRLILFSKLFVLTGMTWTLAVVNSIYLIYHLY
jgi:hypothetical protein